MYLCFTLCSFFNSKITMSLWSLHSAINHIHDYSKVWTHNYYSSNLIFIHVSADQPSTNCIRMKWISTRWSKPLEGKPVYWSMNLFGNSFFCWANDLHLYLLRRARVCVTQISSHFSAANFPLSSLPILPHHYRTRSTLTAHSVVTHSKHRYAGTRQTHFHNALAIVRAAPDWPTLVYIYYAACVRSVWWSFPRTWNFK